MLGGGHQIKARGADIAGFNAIHAVITFHQMVMVMVIDPHINEMVGAEIRIILREMMHQGQTQRCHIAGGGDLVGIRQARGVFELAVAHPQRMRLFGHHGAEILFAAAQPFAQNNGGVIGGFGHQSQDGVFGANTLSGAQTQFRR